MRFKLLTRFPSSSADSRKKVFRQKGSTAPTHISDEAASVSYKKTEKTLGFLRRQRIGALQAEMTSDESGSTLACARGSMHVRSAIVRKRQHRRHGEKNFERSDYCRMERRAAVFNRRPKKILAVLPALTGLPPGIGSFFVGR
jgi:hypothetical protein